MDQLVAMRVYVSVVDAGGFTAASRELGMPLTTVCRKIAELEDHLGTQLLTRTTRRVAATESGLHYYENVRRILEDIEATERQAAGEFQLPKGLLTITAPALFGQLHLLPIVDHFMQRHDEVEVRMFLTNRVLDLSEEHIDLAVRIGPVSPETSNVMTAGTLRQFVCASPTYLDRHGRPALPADLVRHRCITFSRYSNPVPWIFRGPAGKIQHVAIKPRLTVNTAEAATDAARRGAGLTQLYAYQGAADVAAGDLEIVLREFEGEPVPVHVILPYARRLPQKVRAFVDFAMPALEARVAEIAAACDI